jgi:hypothetical protein
MHRRCQSLGIEGYWDGGAGVRPKDDHAGALPEICQKLRYTHLAPPHDSTLGSAFLPGRLCGHVKCCMAV